MRHAYFYMMTLSYMTLKTKNPSFLNSCADKIFCMFVTNFNDERTVVINNNAGK